MLAPIRMWMGACLSSLRRSGSSSWRLGMRRYGSGMVLNMSPQYESTLWVQDLSPRNESKHGSKFDSHI